VGEAAPGGSAGAGSGSSPVAGISMPELISLSGCERVSILKLDIEGAEKGLFETGAEEWLGLIDLIIIELHDRYHFGCSSTFYRALTGYEFGQYPLGENIVVALNPRAFA
jgi:hypothetical protein